MVVPGDDPIDDIFPLVVEKVASNWCGFLLESFGLLGFQENNDTPSITFIPW
jgi:hypothetical protein